MLARCSRVRITAARTVRWAPRSALRQGTGGTSMGLNFGNAVFATCAVANLPFCQGGVASFFF